MAEAELGAKRLEARECQGWPTATEAGTEAWNSLS